MTGIADGRHRRPYDPAMSESMQNQTALVTGASSGIGRELARVHAGFGGDLILVARGEEALNELAAELRDRHGVTVEVVPRDLAVPNAAAGLWEEIRRRGLTVDVLVNNAGFGLHGPFAEQDADRLSAMLRLNVLTLTDLTRLALPPMLARGRGRVLNLASVAAFVPGPLLAVYYASKAYVLSLSEALAEEVNGTGVTVTALCPGATETDFKNRADMGGVAAFEKTAVPAAPVARAGYRAMLEGKPVFVYGAANKFLAHGLLRLVPRGVVRWASKRSMQKG